ncbi:MAG TPA: pilin, type IV [Bryobacteraceae bacterium]|jgi:hypothetical protein
MNAPKKVAVAVAVGLLSILATVACNADKKLAAAQETAAILRIKTIQQAETQYYAQFGKYAASLSQLQDLIPADLASGKSNGYALSLTSRPNGFAVTAAPEPANPSSGRTFYSDETLAIRAESGAKAADATSPEIN